MTESRPDSLPPKRTDRRLFLTGLTSAVLGLAGCAGREEDETPNAQSTTAETTATATPTGADETVTTTETPSAPTATSEQTDTPADDSQYTLTFEHPDEVLVDEPFGMTISGLPQNARVEVRRGELGRVGTTTATVETDENGQIDLTDATVVGGDVPSDLDVPLTVALVQFREGRGSGEESERYGVSFEGTDLGSSQLTRRLPDFEPDQYVEREDLVGGLFEPANGDQGPGVVVLHGSSGEPSFFVAGQLAQRGFTTFALHYFNGPGLPSDLAEVPLEYVERATSFLLDHESAVGEQAGVYGVSKGGELSLLAGSQYDSIGAVVSMVGSGVVWEGSWVENVDTGRSSWSLDGEPLPYVPLAVEEHDHDAFPESYQQSFEEASAETVEAATIPVENIDGPVLLVAGEDDGIWPSAQYHAIAEERLEANGHPNFESLVYENTGHGIQPPYYPMQRATQQGGTLEGNSFASHDHWPHVLETLSAVGPDT